MDISLSANRNGTQINPTSVHGMLWLQTHFENDQWESLSNSSVIISEESSKLLIEDAKSSGLNIKLFSGVSMLDVFQKNT